MTAARIALAHGNVTLTVEAQRAFILNIDLLKSLHVISAATGTALTAAAAQVLAVLG